MAGTPKGKVKETRRGLQRSTVGADLLLVRQTNIQAKHEATRMPAEATYMPDQAAHKAYDAAWALPFASYIS